MTQLNEAFDPSSVPPSDPGGQGLPISDDTGWLVRITNSQWMPVQSNANHGRLVFTLEIIDGAQRGVTGQWGFNLVHSNQQTVEIARRELSALCYVTGVFNVVTDTSVLHNRPFRALVRQQKNNPQYTEVYGVKDQYGRTPSEVKNAGPAAQAGPPAAAPPPAAVPSAPPAPAQPVQAPAPPAQAAPPSQPPAAASAPPSAAPATPPPVAPGAPTTQKAPWE